MNDAERDAWLREALRHAPDSDALPPSGVSEAILLKARAAARAGAMSSRRAATGIAPLANPLAAFWAWLARPPVAAGFASVMAATLVGLMWWDRPMDETMPRPPALASDRADSAPPLAATAPATAAAPAAATAPALEATPAPAAAPPALPADATKATTPARSKAVTSAAADDREVERRLKGALGQPAAGNAQLAEPATAAAKRKVEPLAKEHGLTAERKNEAPAPFPSREAQREMPVAAAPKSLDAAATDTKKDAGASRSRAADAIDRAAVPPAAQAVAPTPPSAARPPPAAAAIPAPTSPLASGRLAADESRPAAAVRSETAAAMGGAGAAPAPATTTAPPREVAAAPFGERIQRQRALGDARDKDAAGFASSAPAPVTAQAPAPAPAPFRNELERASPDSTVRAAAAKQAVDPATRADATARPDAATRADAPARTDGMVRADTPVRAGAATRTAPLSPLLTAIAADPERWSRQTASGDTVALDAGWRAWLAELDAAAAGRWQPLAGGTTSADGAAARDGTTTLRLVTAGRVAAVVRSDGATVHVDASPGTGAERWQATLSPDSAERLRTTARRLAP